MTVLSVENVSKRYRRGRREYCALRDVSMVIERGELAVVLGTRKSGRTTLLRIAAGLERPDDGVVRFEDAPLVASRDVIGRRISYCHTSFSPMEGESVLDHVAAGLLAQRNSRALARRAAARALARTEVVECAGMNPDELNADEAVRVAIARAIAPAPSVLVIDDPTAAVGFLHGDAILRLLRSIAGEGVAVLMSSDDATCVPGTDRSFSLDDGSLRFSVQAPRADVLPLRRRAGQAEPRR